MMRPSPAPRSACRSPSPLCGERVRVRGVLGVGLLLAMLIASAAFAEEPPSLAADVASGKLPPLAQRLPKTPCVVDIARPGWATGRYGGELRMLMAKDRDIRMMVVYGYARLIGYDEKLQLVP